MSSRLRGSCARFLQTFWPIAWDAIGEHGVIALRASSHASFKGGKRYVRITIADNGTGISPQMQQQVFDALFTTKGSIGTGLGLWVSKQIIDKHAGTIRLRSRTEKACTGQFSRSRDLPSRRPSCWKNQQ